MGYTVDRHGVLSDGVGCRAATQAEALAFAKIESDAKVIAALRDALRDNVELLDYAMSGYIGGCRLDMDWNKSRDEVIKESKKLLATLEQTAGET